MKKKSINEIIRKGRKNSTKEEIKRTIEKREECWKEIEETSKENIEAIKKGVEEQRSKNQPAIPGSIWSRSR